MPTKLKRPHTKFHYKHFGYSPSVFLRQKKKTHYPGQMINETFEPRASRTRSMSANLSWEIFIRL